MNEGHEDERKLGRRRVWAAAFVVLMPAVYALSIGPAVAYTVSPSVSPVLWVWMDFVYGPLYWITDATDAHDLCFRYIIWWCEIVR